MKLFLVDCAFKASRLAASFCERDGRARRNSRLNGGFVLLVLLTGSASAQERALDIQVTGGKTAAKDVPITVPLSLPADWVKEVVLGVVDIRLPDSKGTLGQLTSSGILTDDIAPSDKKLVRRDLHFILPQIDVDQTVVAKVYFRPHMTKRVFWWKEGTDDYAELDRNSRPLLRLIRKPYDDSSPAARDASYKVFHHLYDPEGKRLVSAGGYADADSADKKLLYPHHRGIMYGFNKITYDGDKKADTWHCTNGAHVAFVKDLSTEAGPVLGRQRIRLDWYGSKTDVFAHEQRELTAYAVPGGTLIRFVSKLETTDGKVHLDGDPQHAGFQFRASQDVVGSSAKTYYLHPDGSKGEPGKERNWPDDKTQVDLPWYAMSFEIGGQRYTACYLNGPLNPRPSRFSERNYGRFGGYFAYDLTKEQPLIVNYELWLQDGEITADRAQELYRAFASPPQAKVVTQ